MYQLILITKTIFFFIFLQNFAYANYRQEFTASFAMLSSSFTENNSSQETESDVEQAPVSGATSQMSLDLSWRFLSSNNKGYYLRATLPFLKTDNTGIFSVSGGMNFFIMSNSTAMESRFLGNRAVIVPEWRFYWGPELGITYHIYTTEVADKSDTLFDIGAHLGANYTFNNHWGAVVEAHVLKGTGVATSDLKIKFFAGMTYFLNIE